MKVCVTGHRGYTGRKLVPALEKSGHEVLRTMDWLEGKDIRSSSVIKKGFDGCDTIIHLANISNDPSFDLKPGLAKSVNWECFPMMIEEAAKSGVKRFIFASSSSVYGVKKEKNVTEDLLLEPLTEYSKYKALCEEYLIQACPEEMEFIIVRPATICGYSPAMRLDLLVNIFTYHAWQFGKITVHGGSQYRPNIHIDDMVDAYVALLGAPSEKVNRDIFNVGYQNLTLLETAELVKDVWGNHVDIKIEKSRDERSYHVNSDKINRILGFTCKRTIRNAIEDMICAFDSGAIPDPTDEKYYRVRQMNKMA